MADPAKIPDDAVLDGEVPARVEQDAVCPAAKSLDGQAAQMNAVARAGIDRDANARCGVDAGGAIAEDADRLGDSHVRHGAASPQVPLSVPCPETEVRFGPACAGAAEKPRARRAAAKVGNDAIMFGIDVIFIMVRHIFYRLLICVNSLVLPEQHTRKGAKAKPFWRLLAVALANQPTSNRTLLGNQAGASIRLHYHQDVGLFVGLRTALLKHTVKSICYKNIGGEGGIRTPDRLAPMPHFECGAFNRSATSPTH
jgi:hypothetical protein